MLFAVDYSSPFQLALLVLGLVYVLAFIPFYLFTHPALWPVAVYNVILWLVLCLVSQRQQGLGFRVIRPQARAYKG